MELLDNPGGERNGPPRSVLALWNQTVELAKVEAVEKVLELLAQQSDPVTIWTVLEWTSYRPGRNDGAQV
jgi:hypothetical protein